MSNTTAVLVVDVQNGLTQGPTRVYDADGLVARIRGLTERARAANIPVIYIQDDDVGPLDSEAWQLDPGLAAQPSDPRIRKAYSDSFYQTDLQQLLAKHSAKRLVIVGCQTDACVDMTARRAVALGYDVVLGGDGHSTVDNEFMPAPVSIQYYNVVLDEIGLKDGFGAGKNHLRVQPIAEIRLA